MHRQRQNCHRDRQIQSGPRLFKFGWREVDDDLISREEKAAIYKGGTDTFAALKDGFIGHADNAKTGEATVRIALNGDNFVFKAIRYGAVGFTGHRSDYKALRIDFKA